MPPELGSTPAIGRVHFYADDEQVAERVQLVLEALDLEPVRLVEGADARRRWGLRRLALSCRLSERQADVLARFAAGLELPAIAEAVSRPCTWVGHDLRRALAKVGATDRSTLLRKVYALELVS